MSDSLYPKKFVGLHSHSTFSVADAIGKPEDHIDFAIKNGSDALALTDHGNMCGFSSQYLHAKKLEKKGVQFKPIYGMEAYFIPSISDWKKLKEENEIAKAREKELKKQISENKKSKKAGKTKEEIGDELADTKEMLSELAASMAVPTEDEDGGTVMENEIETKSNKWQNPINSRSHLVLLAKNSAGLEALFKLNSRSFIDGFYKYPRIDFDMLRKEAKGNIIALQACAGGNLASIVYKHQLTTDWDLWAPNDDNFEIIQRELASRIQEFQEALGEENYYIELQYNKLGAQHLINYHFIEASKRTGVPLVVTVDAHYSNPDHWREREIYKAMAWASKSKGQLSIDSIPKIVDDLKCELYPKNHIQVWDSYKKYCSEYSFYNDELMKDAIERTWDIAHNQIGFAEPNKSVKLPAIKTLVPEDILKTEIEKLGESADEDALAFEDLKRLAKEGLIQRGKQNQQEYIDRLVYELKVVKHLKFSKYFLTYAKVMTLLGEQMITGPARGSAGGSLLAYVLQITQIDPVKYGLLFERFLVKSKMCLDPDTLVKTNNGVIPLKDLSVGDSVLTHTMEYKSITHITSSEHNEIYKIETESGETFVCSPNHIWVVIRNGIRQEIKAFEMEESDELIEIL